MNTNKLRIIIYVAAIYLSAAVICAAEPEPIDPFEISLEENIEYPVVPNKSKANVKEANERLRIAIERAGFKTSKLRHGEVLMINIPCDRLFRANAMTLSPEGRVMLDKLAILTEYNGKYKMLIAVHTDDTGDEKYADAITSDRANAIDDYLSEQTELKDMIIIPYGIGRDEPIGSNDSIKKRSLNRRVEIYLVPQEALYSKKR